MAHIMLLTNQPSAGHQPGYHDALNTLAANSEISGFDVLRVILDVPEGPAERSRRVAREISRSRADILLCLSLKDLVQDAAEVSDAIAGRTVIYWEGDAWGRGKRFPEVAGAWLKASAVVFSVAGPPQAQLLLTHGAREVRQTVHTYDQTLFANLPESHRDPATVVFIGNNLARIPGITGLPGSAARRRLVSGLRKRFGHDFRLGGRGWPSRFAAEPVRYPDLARFIRSGRILASWEHFPSHMSYASDRLAVGMVSSRVLVTSRPSGPWWVPETAGVFTHSEWGDVLSHVEQLAALPSHRLDEAGCEARRWALNRLSHLEALRHMLHPFVPGVDAPPRDPWTMLPGPWFTH